jgi:hypothetical protein
MGCMARKPASMSGQGRTLNVHASATISRRPLTSPATHVPEVVPLHAPVARQVAVGAPVEPGMKPVEHVAVQFAPTRVGLQA